MRQRMIAGNWKMNKTPKEGVTLIEALKGAVNNPMVEVLMCVPFVDIHTALEAVKDTSIKIGAQNMHYETSGAYTGEISAEMLAEAGVYAVVIGHSERRAYFGETDEDVNKKVLKALQTGLVPIMCVGETLTQREQGITIDFIRMQVKIGLKDVPAAEASKVVVAYEPVWAIGTGKTASNAQAEEVCAAIRQVLAELYGQAVADDMRILYGGSVNGANAKELFAMGNIDGGLVGGASLKPDFADIVNA